MSKHEADPAHAPLQDLSVWFPRRFLLAIDIMLDIAFNSAAGPLPAAELGQRQELETRKLEAILQRLGRAGLLKSLRGPNGGYFLARERASISVGDIARALFEGEESSGEGAGESFPSATMRQVVLPAVGGIRTGMMKSFDALTLDELCRQARAAGLAAKADGMVDFTI